MIFFKKNWKQLVIYGISLILLVLIGIKLKNYFSGNPKLQPIEEALERRDLDIIFGSDTAKLSVYMYSSYNCTYCRLFFTDVYPTFKNEFIDNSKVNLIVRLTDKSGNEDIENSLKTAVCINKYGYFNKLNELLLADSRVVFTPEFQNMIADFIEKDNFVAECILGGSAENYLLQNRKDFDNFDFKGTPTFVINNKAYSGFRVYDEFKNIIENHLNKDN